MENEFLINTVLEDDLKGIFELEKQVFGKMSYPLFVLRQFYDICQDCFLIATDSQNKVLGYTLGNYNIQTQTGWILSLAVSADIQSKGVGFSLSQSLIEKMKNHGITQIFLTVSPTNHAALKLYKKLQFVAHSFDNNYYGDQEERMVMCLNPKL